VDEQWEHSAATAAAVFLRLERRRVARVTVDATASGEGGGPQQVIVTLDGLPDDSIRSERWRLELDARETARLHAELGCSRTALLARARALGLRARAVRLTQG